MAIFTASCGVIMILTLGLILGMYTRTGWRWCSMAEILFVAIFLMLGMAIHMTLYNFWSWVKDIHTARKKRRR